MSEVQTSFLDRTLRGFRLAWRQAGGRAPLKDTVSPDLSGHGEERVRAQIDACLEGRGGDVSARARAAGLGETYLVLNAVGRRRFLRLLASEYDVDEERVDAAIAQRASAVDAESRRKAENALRQALVAPRIRLLTQFNGLRQGIKFLVDLRAELLDFARGDALLEAFDREVRELLKSWFDVGFLNLVRITWHTSASLLEKLIAYEAVHAVRSWDDLKNRLGADRRCFAFFHPNMPDEPLIFVQVALVVGMSDNVQALLDERAPVVEPTQADTAIFYSISNCQRGLAGVGFGDFLIKRVADDVSRELPNVKTFATLSPIPGFRGWLERLDDEAIRKMLGEARTQQVLGVARSESVAAGLRRLLEAEGWQETVADALREPLLRLCARYLLEARRGRRAYDRVAHFHLSNGAGVERINWLADTSERGLAQSAGMMVNYRYDLDKVEANHEAYTGEGRITAAAQVRRLLKP